MPSRSVAARAPRTPTRRSRRRASKTRKSRKPPARERRGFFLDPVGSMKRLIRRAGLGVAAVALWAAAAGCFGPQRMSRRMDDWANQAYVDNPWLMGNSVSYALLTTIFTGLRFVDGFMNAFYF